MSVKHRPSSGSSSVNQSDQSTPADSQEDLRRGFTQSEGGSALHLLAENLHRLEKGGGASSPSSRQKSAWSNLNIGGKLRSARKSSKKLSNYALNKLSSGNVLLRRSRRAPKDKDAVREVQSDTEDDDLSTNSTPLLYSMSASHSNLTSTSTATPPPKPPRTFKTKKLLSLAAMECPIQDGEDEAIDGCDDQFGEFSSDVLSAIKEVGYIYEQSKDLDRDPLSKSDGTVIANGCVPSAKGDGSNGGGTEGKVVHLLTRSESSPLLSHSGIKILNEEDGGESQSLEPNSQEESTRSSPKSTDLQPITEDRTAASGEKEPSSETKESTGADEEVTLPSREDNVRLVNSVPMRRKRITPVTEGGLVSVSLTYPSVEGMDSEVDEDLDKSTDLKQYFDTSSNGNKRRSILSITSADFYSAVSSEASDSKPSSISASPDHLFRDSISSQVSVSPPHLPDIEGVSLRVPSSLDDECFSTPPSSPNVVTESQEEFEKAQDGGEEESVDSPTILPAPQDTSSSDVSGQADSEGQGSIDFAGQESSITGQSDANEQKSDVAGQESNIAGHTDTSEQKGDVAEPSNITGQVDSSEQNSLSTKELTEKEPSPSKVEDTSSSQIGNGFIVNGSHPSPSHGSNQTTPKRKRSLTVSESMPIPSFSQPALTHVYSKDDNFDTEYKNEGLVSSFSQQDFKDIFGESTLPKFNIEPVPEGEGEEEGEMGDQEELTGSEGDLSASPSPLEMSRVVTPETIEPVTIPDDVTPDMVSVLYCIQQLHL